MLTLEDEELLESVESQLHAFVQIEAGQIDRLGMGLGRLIDYRDNRATHANEIINLVRAHDKLHGR